MIRTGEKFEWRKCPRHGLPMELALDNKSSAFSPLFWWCEGCHGFWAQEYFYFQHEKSLPVRAMKGNFVFPCPKCGSLNTYHDCAPSCCEANVCRACKHMFELRAEVHEAHAKPDQVKPYVETLDRLHMGAAYAVGDSEIRLLTLTINNCPHHTTTPMKLAVHEANTENLRLGWYCEVDRMYYPDFHFREARPVFVSPGYPGVVCPVCHGENLDSLEDMNYARCLGCESIVRLRILTEEEKKVAFKKTVPMPLP